MDHDGLIQEIERLRAAEEMSHQAAENAFRNRDSAVAEIERLISLVAVMRVWGRNCECGWNMGYVADQWTASPCPQCRLIRGMLAVSAGESRG